MSDDSLPLSFDRRSTIKSLADSAVPLLKFDNDKAKLVPQGLEIIQNLPGRIYPVIFMGDGRAGKSYLASRLLDLEEGFLSSDSAEPVTEGIDLLVRDVSDLVASCPGIEGQPVLPDQEQVHMLVLDCEGGNNAMAAIRTLVNVFGILIGTEVVFVTGATISESAFQTLAQTIAARSLIKFDTENELPEQRLSFVVNKNQLNYNSESLEKALKSEQTDPSRRECRDMVMDKFPQRSFVHVPFMGLPGFEDKITSLRQSVLQACRPLTMGGTPVNGPALCNVLELIVEQMEDQKEVSMPSMNRCVLLDGFLTPLRERLFELFCDRFPDIADYEPSLENRDPLKSILGTFDEEATHIRSRALVDEARRELQDKMGLVWNGLVQKNKALGEQTRETKTEQKEILGMEEQRPVGGGGMLKDVMLTHQHKRVLMRTVMIKKNLAQVASDWTEMQGESWKLKEDAFSGLSTGLPILQGKLLKKSPSVMQNILTAGHGKFQERCCVIREGFVIWWDPKKVPMPTRTDSEVERKKKERATVQGCINFFLNKARVVKDDEHAFRIMPANEEEGWTDSTSFSGGQNRQITFQVGTRETLGSEFWPIDRWISVIQRNIDFAQRAAAQLGQQRIVEEVNPGAPPLHRAIWRNRV